MKKETMYIIGAVAVGFLATRFFLKSREERKSDFIGKKSNTYFCSATGKAYDASEYNRAKIECTRMGGTLSQGLWAKTGGAFASLERKSSACGCGA